jgi:hypothetical protein
LGVNVESLIVCQPDNREMAGVKAIQARRVWSPVWRRHLHTGQYHYMLVPVTVAHRFRKWFWE